ncbi:hypothetical protein [Rhodomicrobium vannielii]|uniref:hypothetical protein n=1 Tax=Rhodomicrobium vannielii TaxID=1069 RepID=UPI0002F6D993|nr:hypothetical protein [Rhodomicrobium vannielii]
MPKVERGRDLKAFVEGLAFGGRELPVGAEGGDELDALIGEKCGDGFLLRQLVTVLD